ncbi:hypothetical protein NR798_02945 [Archangium gephyra]|uniref:hypothetical protein n=1 Tax=Archangium gephyra TaxID=48 RepID=UPI0035D519D6
MTTFDPDEPGHLRREAAPLEFEQLTSDQRDAGVKAARLIAEMSESRLPEPESSSRHSYLPEIDPIRDNHVVLIDGRRGSGKSLLLLTLLKSYRDAATESKVVADFKGHIHSGHSIIPVGLIDLQPLPEDTNLLFYILGHLERVVEAIEGNQGEPRQRVPEAWEEVDTQELPSRRRWRELARAAAFGWGGNLKERKARLDPESYAVEMEHGELQRLDAIHRFRLFMEALVSDYQQWRRWERNRLPFFLLTIDDADMNPDRSGELLELIRKLWHRRLGFLLTGDSSLFIAKLRAEFETKMSKGDLLRARQLATDVYTKIIPVRQRCALSPIEPDEVLLLPQRTPIRTTLQQFPVLRGEGSLTAQGVQNLAAFFDESLQIRAALPDRLRSLLSIQEELKSILHLRDVTTMSARAVFRIWKKALDAVRLSGFEVEPWQELVRFEAENKLLVVKSTLLRATCESAFWVATPLKPQWEYAVSEPGRLRIFGPGRGSENAVELPPRVVGAFLLAHEFGHTDAHGSYQGSIVPEDARDSFVEVRWIRAGHQRAVVFSWVMPAWSSLIEFERFVKGWKRLLKAVPVDSPSSLDRLGWGFLQLVVQVATGSALEEGDSKQEPDWTQWGQNVVELSKSQSSERAAAMKDWVLVHSAQLATPEAGTSTAFARKLLGALASAYGRDWKQVSEIQLRARAQRAAQAVQRGLARSTDRTSFLAETPENLLREIDSQFPGHPFIRRVGHRSRLRSGDKDEAIRSLVDASLASIRVPFAEEWLRTSETSLILYVNTLRRRLLALNASNVLRQVGNVVYGYRDIGRGAAYAVVALWEECVVARNRKNLKPKVELSGDRVRIRDAPLRQKLHDRIRAQWAQVPKGSWLLRAEPDLRFHLSKRGPEKSLDPSVPLGLEPVLRLAFDYATDQDDLEKGPPPPNEWWPHLQVTISEVGTFAPWPAIPWPSLWEWEELQEIWKEVLKKGRLLTRPGASETFILDALASWLVNAFLTCKTRGRLGSHLRVSQTKEDWVKAALQWRDNLKGEKEHANGRRARAMQVGLESLSLLATPESGLSTDAAEGILIALGPGSRPEVPDISLMNQLRLQRMLDAGIPESKARAALESLDRGLKGHPWVTRVGAFQLPKEGGGRRPKPSDGK